MRLYWPRQAALHGSWQQPPLVRVGASSTDTVPVTIENFVRAESDFYFAATIRNSDAFGKFGHNREPSPIDNQTVIRLNRDALNVLADTLPDKNRMFGAKGDVDPIRHLLGAASGWGGNPDRDAIHYLSITWISHKTRPVLEPATN